MSIQRRREVTKIWILVEFQGLIRSDKGREKVVVMKLEKMSLHYLLMTPSISHLMHHVILPLLRGRSKTILTRFCTFLTPFPLGWPFCLIRFNKQCGHFTKSPPLCLSTHLWRTLRGERPLSVHFDVFFKERVKSL